MTFCAIILFLAQTGIMPIDGTPEYDSGVLFESMLAGELLPEGYWRGFCSDWLNADGTFDGICLSVSRQTQLDYRACCAPTEQADYPDYPEALIQSP
jgi:hypothetical protein